MPKKKTKVLIIEDNRLLLDGISAVINEQTDLKVIATFSEGEKALTQIIELKPDVVLLDLGLRDNDSLQIVKSIKKKSSAIKIIVMDILPVQADVLDFVREGASGFILKDAMVDEFLNTIRSVIAGKEVLPPNMTGSLFSQIIERAVNGTSNTKLVMQAVRMTQRERQIIELIADGLSNKEIANTLSLSPYTIKSHVHNILEKMALHTRVQIARYAYSRRGNKDDSDIIPHLET